MHVIHMTENIMILNTHDKTTDASIYIFKVTVKTKSHPAFS